MVRLYGDNEQNLLRYQFNLTLEHQSKSVTALFPTSYTKKDRRQKERKRTFNGILHEKYKKFNDEK